MFEGEGTQTEILISGSGPVGLTLAIDLAWRGIEVLIVEPRAPGEPPSVKCNHVGARTMEIFRRLGVVQAVRDAGPPDDYPNDAAFRTTTTGLELSRIPIPCRLDRYTATGGPDTWWPTPEPPHRINQIYLEPILPTVLEDLRRLVEPATMGDPLRPLLWVSKSREKLAAALRAMNHAVSANTVAKMLVTQGYSRQVNRKTKEGSHHADRDGQFQHIACQAIVFQAAGQPVIFVDTKKKELIGEYKNGGSDYRPRGRPDAVKVHDLVDKDLGKVAPYGIYDIAANAGWVSVGIDHDTAAFAVNSIRRWHEEVGRERYHTADRLLITADGGGSNGSRERLWKLELQKPGHRRRDGDPQHRHRSLAPRVELHDQPKTIRMTR